MAGVDKWKTGLSSIDQAQLQSETQILQLLYFRNKNQFRLNKWWTQLSVLRRHCKHLVDKLARGPIAADSAAGTAKFIYTKLVPSCYRTFHTLLAQGQFINIGIALLAILAKVNSLLAAVPDIPQTRPPKPQIDVGHVVSRPQFKEAERMEKSELPEALPVGPNDRAPKKPKKQQKTKNRKKKDAIDDIFGF